MKNLFAIIFFLLFINHSAAQQNKIDSLLQILSHEREDTNKVNVLNALSDKSERIGDYENARKYGEDALSLSRSLKLDKRQGWAPGESVAYRRLALLFDDEGNYPEALKNYFASLKIKLEIGDKMGIGNTYNNIGITYSHQGNYSEALKNHVAALRVREEIKDSLGMAWSYGNIANMYTQLGNYEEALKNNFSSLKVMEQIGNKQGVANSYNNIGSIYYYQGNYEVAMKNYSSALEIKKELGDKRGLASTYSNLGNIYVAQKNYPDALKNYFTAKKCYEEFGNKLGVAHQLNLIGNIYDEQSDYSEALKSQFESLTISEEIGDKEGIAVTSISIGDVYTKQKEFARSSQYLNKGLLVAKEIQQKTSIKDAYLSLAKNAFAINDYKNAYAYQELYSMIKDTLLNDENNKHIAQMQAQYESEKKDNEITVLNKDKKIQQQKAVQQKFIRNVFIGGFIVVLIISFLFINRLRLRQVLKLQQVRNKISSDLHDDIGSTLSSIAIYSELANEEVKEKSDRASSLLQSINENSRGTIESMSDIVWAINPKNDRFENILQRMRTFASGILEAKNIDLSFGATASLSDLKLSMEKRKNLYLIFKEAVNNVAKYSGCKNCLMKLWLEGKTLNMEVADDGIGFDINSYEAGNGLLNMKKRCKEMDGNLDIKSTQGSGTTILLSFSTT